MNNKIKSDSWHVLTVDCRCRAACVEAVCTLDTRWRWLCRRKPRPQWHERQSRIGIGVVCDAVSAPPTSTQMPWTHVTHLRPRRPWRMLLVLPLMRRVALMMTMMILSACWRLEHDSLCCSVGTLRSRWHFLASTSQALCDHPNRMPLSIIIIVIMWRRSGWLWSDHPTSSMWHWLTLASLVGDTTARKYAMSQLNKRGVDGASRKHYVQQRVNGAMTKCLLTICRRQNACIGAMAKRH